MMSKLKPTAGRGEERVGEERTMFMTTTPALWSASTASLGGTPTAQTNRAVFSSMMTLIRSIS